MTGARTLPWRAVLAAALAAALACSPAKASPLELYERFAEDGRGTRFLLLSRRAFLSALLHREPLPRPTRESRRPAGPRDEPPPPEWPGGPAGILLCVVRNHQVRGCEGAVEVLPGSSGVLASRLGERLARSSSRGAGARLAEEELSGAELRSWFLLPLEEMAYREFKGAVKMGEIDPLAAAVRLSGRRGEVFIPPGEAESLRDVASVARRAGVAGLFRRPEKVRIFRPVPVARPLALGREAAGPREDAGEPGGR